MERKQTVTRSADVMSVSSPNEVSPWVWIALVLIFVAFIAILIFLVYWFFLRTNPTPITCSKQTCPNGQYCSGLGQCISGSGISPGDSCSKNSDCIYGYDCVSQYCTGSSTVPSNTLPSQFYLTYNFGNSGDVYYLDPNRSVLIKSHFPPRMTFSYDSINQILSINNGDTTTNNIVGVTNRGNLSLTSVAYPLALMGTTSSVQIQHPCGSLLSYIQTSGDIRSVSFYQTSNNTCPGSFQNILGMVPILFNIVPVTSSNELQQVYFPPDIKF